MDWHYQIGRSKITLAEGKTYVLTFRARAMRRRRSLFTLSLSAATGIASALTRRAADDGLADLEIHLRREERHGQYAARFQHREQNGALWIGDLSLSEQKDASTKPVQTTALKINVTTKGNQILDVQTISKPFDVVNGQIYLLAFKARAGTRRARRMSSSGSMARLSCGFRLQYGPHDQFFLARLQLVVHGEQRRRGQQRGRSFFRRPNRRDMDRRHDSDAHRGGYRSKIRVAGRSGGSRGCHPGERLPNCSSATASLSTASTPAASKTSAGIISQAWLPPSKAKIMSTC